MPKFWTSRQFRELNHEWNIKLAATGFQDAEKEIAGERVLRQSSDYAYRRKETADVVRENKCTYFMLLAQCIHTELNFEDNYDRLVMERTAEGRSIREISEELKSLLPEGRQRGKFNRRTIRYIRRRYEDRWGIKTWSQQQMGKVPTQS